MLPHGRSSSSTSTAQHRMRPELCPGMPSIRVAAADEAVDWRHSSLLPSFKPAWGRLDWKLYLTSMERPSTRWDALHQRDGSPNV